MAETIDHVMMRVEDLDESLEWYTTHFGYDEVRERTEANTFTNVFLAPGDKHEDVAYLELTFNHDGRSYEMGDAWGHIGLGVDDVEAAYDRLVDGGVEDHRPPAESHDGNSAFVYDPDGHEIQLVERDGGEEFELDHVMWRVTNLDQAVGWFARKFDYGVVDRVEADGFESLFVNHPDAAGVEASMELRLEDADADYTMGDAWGHIAIRIHGLHETWDRLMARDAADYRPPEDCNNEYAFTKFAEGHEIDLHPH